MHPINNFIQTKNEMIFNRRKTKTDAKSDKIQSKAVEKFLSKESFVFVRNVLPFGNVKIGKSVSENCF